jgi:hypothetical protein
LASPTVASTSTLAAAVAEAPPTAEPSPTVAPTPAPTRAPIPACDPSSPAPSHEFCPTGARVAIDQRIPSRDVVAILAQIEDDLAAVQREFEWTLHTTARIDVYSRTDLYSDGLRTVFGYSKATADYLADNSVAFFEPSLARIAVNWSEISDRRPIAAIRHELTHLVTLEACAPRCDLVPAWLNEGQARLAEALIPGADWRLMRIRYEAASMVTTDAVLPLTALWTQSQWNAYGDWAGYYKYQEAARATELLRADIGDGAIAKLYARMRRGEDVPRAYADLTGRSWSSFTSTLSARMSEGASSFGIATAAPGAEGSGVALLLYGFAPEAKVTFTVRGRHVDETSEITVSPQGAWFWSLDDTYPPGRYTITAASGSSVAAVTVAKRGGRVMQETFD